MDQAPPRPTLPDWCSLPLGPDLLVLELDTPQCRTDAFIALSLLPKNDLLATPFRLLVGDSERQSQVRAHEQKPHDQADPEGKKVPGLIIHSGSQGTLIVTNGGLHLLGFGC